MREISGKLKLNFALDIINKFPNLRIEEIKFKIEKEFLILRYDPVEGCILKYKGNEVRGKDSVEAVRKLREIPSISDELSDVFYEEDDDNVEDNSLDENSNVATVNRYRLR